MTTVSFQKKVHIPSVQEFLAKYPHYAAVTSSERFLYDAVMTPDNFIAGMVVTESMEMPAVSAIADKVKKICGAHGGLTDFRKQLTGALVCNLMESNDYEKTGRKRSISRSDWSKGELYTHV